MLRVLEAGGIGTLDVTGGAPELNPHFRHLVHEARACGIRVIDRCNLTILNEPGFEDLAEFLAREGVEITASLPCYTKDNVDRQRGEHVFDSSILALTKLNALGYGIDGSGLVLNLVYNPLGPSLPPAQDRLEADLQARAGRQFRRRVQPPVHARQHADRALRLDARHAGQVRELHGAPAFGAQPGQPRRRDVPHARLGRLSRLSSTTAISTRCSAFRWSSPGKARRHVTDLLTSSGSTARRSPSPITATAARPVKARAAAARSREPRTAAMRVSIIVPARNEARRIVATLAPLQSLRAAGHEVIVVDGGSADATLALGVAAVPTARSSHPRDARRR